MWGKYLWQLPWMFPQWRTVIGLYLAMSVVRKCHPRTLVMMTNATVWALLHSTLSNVSYVERTSTLKIVWKITTTPNIQTSAANAGRGKQIHVVFFAPTIRDDYKVTYRSIWPGGSSCVIVNFDFIWTVLPCHQNKNHLLTYCSVTKSALWRYLGNQAWYHRSAGVKTTGKKFWIRKFKIPKTKIVKVVRNGQNFQKCLK